jgi:cobalt/nickel transport system permease protein
MHISEGILTGKSMAATLALGAVAVGWGATRINALIKDQPHRKPVMALLGAMVFLVSLTPFPAAPGTTTHPCGTPLAAILLGPGTTIVLASLGLLLQALFFAHGGLSSLGANTLTLGVVGGFFGWATYHLCRRSGLGIFASGAAAGFVGDVMTYVAAGGILGGHLAFFGEHPQHDFVGYLKFIYAAYLPVQAPLAIGEALLTGYAVRAIARQRPEVLEDFGVERKGFAKALALLLILLLPVATLSAAEKAATAAPANVSPAVAAKPAAFNGMDELVNEAAAAAGGAPARAPYIDFESKGDLWNFVLLMGGGLAGFVIGRNWDKLFVKKAA